MIQYKVLFAISLILLLVGMSSANDIMTVEVDIYEFEEFVSIEVPDYFYIGNLTIGDKEVTNPTSDDKIYVNNTGNVDITVTPQLLHSDPIFENLFLTKRLSGDNFEYIRIGDFSFNIEKPSSSGVRSEYFYMRLDIRNYTGVINDDLLGYKADIKFIAVAS